MTERPALEVIRPDWDAPPNVFAFSTTRNGGFSQGPWRSLNFGKSCGDDPEHVAKNRQLLNELLPDAPRWISQVHGTNVASWEEANASIVTADAIYTDKPGQVCAVMTADCLPVVFCDRAGTRVAVAHAGWRGLAAGILESTVARLDCEPAELVAWLGPAIGPEAFEVGKDVYDTFVNQNTEDVIAFKSYRDRWLADIYRLARLRLARVGIDEVSCGDSCTYSDASKFYSYRRDGVTGRMATMIWLAH